jgi:hypothetical protein
MSAEVVSFANGIMTVNFGGKLTQPELAGVEDAHAWLVADASVGPGQPCASQIQCPPPVTKYLARKPWCKIGTTGLKRFLPSALLIPRRSGK